jgi:hypothetical protein
MGAAIGPSYRSKISKQATMIGKQAAIIRQASGDDRRKNMRVIDVIRAMHSFPFPDKQCEFGGYTLHMHTNGKVTLKGPNLSEVEVFISADIDDESIDFFIRNVPPTPANLLLTISYGQEVGGRIE